jgi:hypothetical protein
VEEVLGALRPGDILTHCFHPAGPEPSSALVDVAMGLKVIHAPPCIFQNISYLHTEIRIKA